MRSRGQLHGKVILTNRAADAILKRGDGRDGLRAASHQETAKLRNAIVAVCTQRDFGIPKSETVIQVHRPSGSKPFEVLVSPLPSHSSLRNGGAAAALFITDPEEGPALDRRALRELFGLTTAEIRLPVIEGFTQYSQGHRLKAWECYGGGGHSRLSQRLARG